MEHADIYLALLLSMSNADSIIAQIDPESETVSGYVVEQCKISAICVNKITEVHGRITHDGYLEMHDKSGAMFWFKP